MLADCSLERERHLELPGAQYLSYLLSQPGKRVAFKGKLVCCTQEVLETSQEATAERTARTQRRTAVVIEERNNQVVEDVTSHSGSE